MKAKEQEEVEKRKSDFRMVGSAKSEEDALTDAME